MTVSGDPAHNLDREPLGAEADDAEDGESADRAEPEPQPWDLEHEPSLGRGLPDGPVPGVVYAALPLRALTFLVDVLLAQLGALFIVHIAVASVQYMIDSSWFGPTPGLTSLLYLAAGVLSWVVAAAGYLYFVRFLRATPGQTFLGLFTLRADGRPLATVPIFLRWLLTIWPTLLATPISAIVLLLADQEQRSGIALAAAVLPVVWLAILAVSIWRDPIGRGLHDRLTHAVVVRRAGSPS